MVVSLGTKLIELLMLPFSSRRLSAQKFILIIFYFLIPQLSPSLTIFNLIYFIFLQNSF